MELILIFFGAAIFGGLSILDFDSSDDSDDGGLQTENLNQDDTSELDVETGTTSNPLTQALELELDAIEVMPQTTDLETQEPDPSEASGNQDLIIYDGVSDEALGYTDKSFGISHRFYENEVIAQTLVGGEGNDLIYAGVGSTAYGGEGSDDFELFLPDGVFGNEVFVLGDFVPSHETLTILLEKGVESDETIALPEVDLVSEATNEMLLQINGTPVTSINSTEEEVSIALSVDGHGEVFFNPAGEELSPEELDQTAIRVIYVTDNLLFGL